MFSDFHPQTPCQQALHIGYSGVTKLPSNYIPEIRFALRVCPESPKERPSVALRAPRYHRLPCDLILSLTQPKPRTPFSQPDNGTPVLQVGTALAPGRHCQPTWVGSYLTQEGSASPCLCGKLSTAEYSYFPVAGNVDVEMVVLPTEWEPAACPRDTPTQEGQVGSNTHCDPQPETPFKHALSGAGPKPTEWADRDPRPKYKRLVGLSRPFDPEPVSGFPIWAGPERRKTSLSPSPRKAPTFWEPGRIPT